jgi:peptidoglycan/LPS O-acetylase OafA/YrhL
MGRNLRYIGIAMLAACAWMLVAVESDWIPDSLPAIAIPLLAGAGALCFIGGMLLGVMTPVGRKLRRGRCVRCGAAIERGQSYCLDHLKETVHEYQERARQGEMPRSGRRA